MALSDSRLGRWLAGARAAPPETKTTTSLFAVAFDTPPEWTPRGYQSLARAGYERNPVVYRCVRMIAEAAASLRMIVYDGARELDDSPLGRLIERPNPREAGAVFLERLYGHLLIAGNAYVEAIGLGEAVRELHLLRPDRVRVVAGEDGWPVAYDYRVGECTRRYVQDGVPPPILHLALFHPEDDHYGLSPLQAAQTPLDLHNAAARWNKALLDNAARPSGALVYAAGSGHLTEDQFARLKREFEESFQGALNAGRPLLLEGGLDWKPLALSPKDMDFNEAKNVAAREIALAFGVPPMLLGIPGDNTYSNYAEANRAFWRQTVLPLARRTAGALAAWLAPLHGAATRVDFDLDGIEGLSEDRAALWRRVAEAPFLTTNERRAAVGYGAVPGGDAVPEDAHE